MTMSPDQAMEASVFLTIYREAIEGLEQSALRNASHQVIEKFTDQVIKSTSSRQFLRFCNPMENSHSKLSMSKYDGLIRDVRAFQFSQYLFAKYLPDWGTFNGDSQELIKLMREKSFLIEKDLRN